jgi:sulfur carrier protein
MKAPVQSMQIQVNGENRQVAEGTTIAALARELEVKPERVAVEINLEILDRGEFERRILREGDHVEIMSFMGGGTEEVESFIH